MAARGYAAICGCLPMTHLSLLLIRLMERLNWCALCVLALVTRWRWRWRDQTGDTWEDLDRYGKWWR